MNLRLIKKIIFEKGISISVLARLAGIRRSTLIIRLCGIGEFKAWEILTISNILGLEENLIGQIFFGQKVS